MIIGGASLAAQTAEHVMPERPAGPSVVMTETGVAICAMASRNCWADTAQPAPAEDVPAVTVGADTVRRDAVIGASPFCVQCGTIVCGRPISAPARASLAPIASPKL
jgi:hypothetical protein